MKKVRVLCYHRVIELCNDFNMIAVSPTNFKAQMKYIKDNYEVLRADRLDEESLRGGKDGVIITFDDGYYDLVYNMLPIIEDLQIPVSIFVATGNLNRKSENWTDEILRAIFESKNFKESFSVNNEFITCTWRTQTLSDRVRLYHSIRALLLHANCTIKTKIIGELNEWGGIKDRINGRANRRMMTFEELRVISQSPFVSIGAHTISHPSLRWLSREEQENEIVGSKEAIELITGKNVEIFAYPFGTRDDYSDMTIDILRRNGFTRAFTTENGSIDLEDKYRVPRSVVRNYSLNDFKTFLDRMFLDKPQEEKTCDEIQSSNIVYIGSLTEDQAVKTAKNIIIWGVGTYGKELYCNLTSLGLENQIIGFGDNFSREKVVFGKPVFDPEVVKEFNAAILIKGVYDWEICVKLIDEGLKNIHIITRE